MRNLKKLLAVITVVALMATLFVIPASAAAPTDVAGTAYESAVTRLNALGIITGRTDGKFYPADSITRAEFAAVVVRSLGYADAATAAKGQTKFTDVNADFWAAGYINLATSLGIVKGRPDGTFGANDKVLYEEAITMIVRALGYEPAAAAQGGYPTGYMVIANQEDITEDAISAIGIPATRGLVSILVDNALEVNLMEQTAYGTETKFEKGDKTLLDDKLKLDVYEARVLATGDEFEVRYTNNTDNPADKRNVKETLDVFESISQAGLKDCLVTLWVKDDMVYNIKNDSTVYYDTISKINDKDDVADITTVKNINDITLKIADSSFDLKLNGDEDVVAANVEVKVNTTAIADYTAANSADALLDKFAKVVVEDGNVVKILAYNLTEGGILTAVAADSFEFTIGATEGKKIRGIEDAESLLVVIDNAPAEYTKLAADMYIDYYKDADDNYVLAASTKKIEGKLTRAKVDEIAIDAVYTDLEDVSYLSDDNGGEYAVYGGDSDEFADYLGENVVAYLNLVGNIAYVKGAVEESTTSFYGFAKTASLFAVENEQIKILKSVDGEDKTVTYDTDLDDDSPILLTNAGFDGDIATAAERLDSFFKFTVNTDNVITKIEAAGSVASFIGNGIGTDTGADFNKDSNMIYGVGGTPKVYVNDDTLIFDITAGDDIAVLKWTAIEDADIANTHDVVAYYKQNDTSAPAFVLLNNSEGAVSFNGKTGYFGLVLDTDRVDADNFEFEVAVPGSEKILTVDEDKGGDATDKYDIVAYRLTSTTDKIEVVATATYDDLSSLDVVAGITSDDDWEDVLPTTLAVDGKGIDGSYIKLVNNTVYRVAADAVIYEVSGDDMDEFTASTLSDIDEDGDGGTSNVSILLVKGEVKMLFFWE